MMMKKNVAGMKGAAGRPGRPGLPGLPGRPGQPGLGSMGSKPPSQVQQMFPRNPTGMQFNQSPPPNMTGELYGMNNLNSGMYGIGSNLQPQQQMPSGMITNKMKKGGNVKPKNMMDGDMAYSKGGSASSRADGIARKGKTKGKMV